MHIRDVAQRYPVLAPVIQRIETVDKIETLFPPQVDAINSGYLDGKNLLLTIPTSTGKTLISELAALKTILEKRKKVLYLVPLKALAMEKYKEFKEKYEPLGVKCSVSIGDLDSDDSYLESFDLVIASVEKADSLLRHNSPFFSKIGLIVADEIHLLDDPSRGPTLEIVLTRLLTMLSQVQIVALSATVKNNDEMAQWLNAKLVQSTFRPTKLLQGVYSPDAIEIDNKRISMKETDEPAAAIAAMYAKAAKQSIVFVSSRNSAESESERVAKELDLSSARLTALSEKILNVLQHPTKQCRRLANVVAKGAAFHHAGLHHKQKELVEDAFRKGTIKVICSTTTLAFGLNLPCDLVIMRDVKRYYEGRGFRHIPVLEYRQCVGRSGRVKYTKEGHAITICKSEDETEDVKEIFINGETETIYSKLALEPVLRVQLLSLIATGGISTKSQMMEFMRRTFYGHQYNNLSELSRKIERTLQLLEMYELIEMRSQGDVKTNDLFQSAYSYKEDVRLKATDLGIRVAELYIDPETAFRFVQAVKVAESKKANYFSFLHLISSVAEMRPPVRVKADDYESLAEIAEKHRHLLLIPQDDLYDEEHFLATLKTAQMFDAWINEKTEDELLQKYATAPGELRVKMLNADWLLYSLQELSVLLGFSNLHKPLGRLRTRVKHGVSEELLPLVRIKGVGRVKGRKLFSLGMKSLIDAVRIPYPQLKLSVGKKTAQSLKLKVGQETEIRQFEHTQTGLDQFKDQNL